MQRPIQKEVVTQRQTDMIHDMTLVTGPVRRGLGSDRLLATGESKHFQGRGHYNVRLMSLYAV